MTLFKFMSSPTACAKSSVRRIAKTDRRVLARVQFSIRQFWNTAKSAAHTDAPDAIATARTTFFNSLNSITAALENASPELTTAISDELNLANRFESSSFIQLVAFYEKIYTTQGLTPDEQATMDAFNAKVTIEGVDSDPTYELAAPSATRATNHTYDHLIFPIQKKTQDDRIYGVLERNIPDGCTRPKESLYSHLTNPDIIYEEGPFEAPIIPIYKTRSTIRKSTTVANNTFTYTPAFQPTTAAAGARAKLATSPSKNRSQKNKKATLGRSPAGKAKMTRRQSLLGRIEKESKLSGIVDHLFFHTEVAKFNDQGYQLTLEDARFIANTLMWFVDTSDTIDTTDSDRQSEFILALSSLLDHIDRAEAAQSQKELDAHEYTPIGESNTQPSPQAASGHAQAPDNTSRLFASVRRAVAKVKPTITTSHW